MRVKHMAIDSFVLFLFLTLHVNFFILFFFTSRRIVSMFNVVVENEGKELQKFWNFSVMFLLENVIWGGGMKRTFLSLTCLS